MLKVRKPTSQSTWLRLFAAALRHKVRGLVTPASGGNELSKPWGFSEMAAHSYVGTTATAIDRPSLPHAPLRRDSVFSKRQTEKVKPCCAFSVAVTKNDKVFSLELNTMSKGSMLARPCHWTVNTLVFEFRELRDYVI